MTRTPEDGRLLALADVGQRLVGDLTLEQVVEVASSGALGVLAADGASLSCIEHDLGRLRVLRNVGHLAAWQAAAPVDEEYDVGALPLLAVTAEDARCWIGSLDDGRVGTSHHRLLRSLGCYSSISVPVVVGSTVWGEIRATRALGRAVFGPCDVAAGEALAALLAAALGRRAEREALHSAAYRDALTGLGNRRAVDDLLEAVFADAVLSDSVGVVLCDVNGLKRVNDEHGHEVGDRLLRQVASCLSQVAGPLPGALAARLGGDEFCLVARGTTSSDLEAVADRLATMVAALPLGEGLACGWAVAERRPGDAPSATTAARALLRMADAAQYRAKRAGRLPTAPLPAQAAEPTEQQRGLVTAVLTAVETSGADVRRRLEALASTATAVLGATSWAVSVSVDGGPVTIVANEDGARLGFVDEHPFRPGVAFELADYPATAAALEGGVFHATMDTGDPSEQAFLAACGYDETLGAGCRQDARTAWLVELTGDALSAPLGPHAPVLLALVAAAVLGGRSSSVAVDRAPERRGMESVC